MTVEGLQVFSPVRTASIVDVTTNTLGGPAGAISAVLIIAFVRKARDNRSYFRVPAMLLAAPYAVAVFCEALTPLFYSSPPPLAEGSPFSRFATSLHASLPIEWRWPDVFDLPLFAAAGALLVIARRERRGAASHPWLVVAALGSVVLLAAHVAHGFLSLPIRWDAIITDIASLAVGALIADRWFGPFSQRYRGASRARVMIFAYIALLVVWAWRPFLLETRADAIMAQIDLPAFIPLSGLGDRVDSFSVFHVVQQFALYVPVGALIAVWPFRSSGWRSSLWPAIIIAVVIELGHIVVVSRTFDTTNALLTSSGLAFGWTIVRRCGYRPTST
jgi:glycopeptide antibiotics resistance protein